MTLDLNTYSINRPYIQQWYRESVDKDISNAVSILASATQTPCIALCFYLAEDIGYNEEIVKIMDRLVQFYDYKHILNQQPDSPYLTSLA